MEEDVKPGKAAKAKGKARGKKVSAKVAAVPKAQKPSPAKAAEPKAAAKPKATINLSRREVIMALRTKEAGRLLPHPCAGAVRPGGAGECDRLL
jgi:hypothetical protein